MYTSRPHHQRRQDGKTWRREGQAAGAQRGLFCGYSTSLRVDDHQYGQDWMMLLSIVSGLTLVHLLTDLWNVLPRMQREWSGAAEEVELLEHDAEEGTEDDKNVDRDQPL